MRFSDLLLDFAVLAAIGALSVYAYKQTVRWLKLIGGWG